MTYNAYGQVPATGMFFVAQAGMEHGPYPSAAEAVAVARTSGLTDSDSAFMGCLAA